MQLASALLEYLVSGFVALLWLVPIVQAALGPNASLPNVNEPSVTLYLPIAYVLGIFLDATSSFILEPFRYHGNSRSSYDRTTHILSYGTEHVIKTMEAYVGRDRIARGVVLSAVVSIPVYFFTFEGRSRTLALVAAFVAIWSFIIWRRLDHLSSKFKDQALLRLPPMTVKASSN